MRTRVGADVVRALPDRLIERQKVFSRTGSLHAAGVFDPGGQLVIAREDVGRHNAVDKVIGARQLGTATYDEDVLLCVSGRIGFDIVTKAVAGRVGTIVAVGGPSSLALELADRAGVTVCGFTRGERFVVYTHPERVERRAEGPRRGGADVSAREPTVFPCACCTPPTGTWAGRSTGKVCSPPSRRTSTISSRWCGPNESTPCSSAATSTTGHSRPSTPWSSPTTPSSG